MFASSGRVFWCWFVLGWDLLKKNFANHFSTSVLTVCRICITWGNFLYLKLKKLPLWPGHDLVKSYMPQAFKDLYQDTRVIIDTTEILINAPVLPELQQMTFSSYKNCNTFKVLVGISSGGELTLVPNLFPGSLTNS